MKKIFFASLAAIAWNAAPAQAIDSTLARYADYYQPEKAYLHYDKTSYFAGETIWFKAYLMEEFIPALGSKTFYVDWIADDGSVLAHSVSPLIDACTNGQFDIPENYAGNYIHVRAYTKWMLNFDTAFLYSKDIRVFNKNPGTNKASLPQPIPSLQFFPEGGEAVAGILNKIAFKAADQWGRPVRIKGVIQDNKGTVVDSFRVVHDGMGFFYWIPKEETSYTAKWKDEKGVEHKTSLPPVRPSGLSMQILLQDTKRLVSINSGNSLSENLKQVHLVGTISQRMVFKTDITVAPAGNVRRVLPTEGLPSGILVITLFDAGWNAVAERITFVNNHEYIFQPSMEVQRWGLSKRKRNEIQISLPDSLQDAHLSVSVTDAAIEKDTSDNIVSHLLLTSELKGLVYNPSYYFSDNSSALAQQLDLVMLTNGWRRFKWEDVVKGKLPVTTYPKDTSYLSLSGKLFGVAKSQLSGNDNIVLMVKEKDSSTKMMIFPVSRAGEFGDPEIIFFDTVQVYYSLKSKFLGLAEARFMADRLPAPNYSSFSKGFIGYRPFSDTSGVYHHSQLAAKDAELRAMQKGSIMETVTVTAKQKTPAQLMEEKYPSGMFKGGDGYQFDLINDPLAGAYSNVLNYLQGKVAGLQINSSQSPPTLSWRGGSPQLYLDELQTDADMINTIPVSDIAYIKVFRPPFMGGFGGSNGAIAVYTRRGSDTKPQGKGLTSNTIAGYTPVRQFYSPNYDRFDPRNDRPDIRTTLYWNPLVNTNQKTHSVTLSFYNNDTAKSFRVVIEGMTKDGLLTHYEQIME
jgi:hypothetical protein